MLTQNQLLHQQELKKRNMGNQIATQRIAMQSNSDRNQPSSLPYNYDDIYTTVSPNVNVALQVIKPYPFSLLLHYLLKF